MKPVKAIDAAFLQLETSATPMHVGALFVLDPGSPPAARTFFRRFKAEVAKCLGLSEVFTRRVEKTGISIRFSVTTVVTGLPRASVPGDWIGLP